MIESDFNNLLIKCYDNYSHEGEFEVQGWKIIIFRKTEEYADCAAFVSNIKNNIYYFTGWFEEDIENDLNELMTDVVQYMFRHGFSVRIKAVGDFNSDDFSQKITKTYIIEDCVNAIENNLVSDSANLSVKVNSKNDTFTTVFNGGYYAWLAVKNNEDLFSTISTKVCCSGKLEFVDQDIKDFTESAFNFNISFY